MFKRTQICTGVLLALGGALTAAPVLAQSSEVVEVTGSRINSGGTVVFKVLVKPLVNLIWLAGFVFVVGSLIVLWPSAAEQRRLAARYRELRALARA